MTPLTAQHKLIPHPFAERGSDQIRHPLRHATTHKPTLHEHGEQITECSVRCGDWACSTFPRIPAAASLGHYNGLSGCDYAVPVLRARAEAGDNL